MIVSEAERAKAAARAFLLVRLSGEFVLRFAEAVRPIFGRDPTLPYVFLAIMQASMRKVSESAVLSAEYADRLVPDDMKVPITILALSQSLEMPRETVRRHVNLLIAGGAVKAVGRKGVIVPQTALDQPHTQSIVTAQAINLRLLLTRLREAGYDPGSI